MIIIPILLSLTLLCVDFYINRKIYSPGVVFNGITFITLFLYSFQLSYIQQTLSWKTILLLTLCIIWFSIPVFIGYSLRFKKRENVKSKDVEQVKPIKLQKTDTFSSKLDLILFLIICSLFVVEVIYNKGFPLIWKLTGSQKTYFDFKMPIVHSFFVPFLILVGSYSLFKKKCYYKWVYLLIPILIISRGFLLSIIVEGCIFYLVRLQKKPKYLWLYSIIGVLVAVIAFGLFGNFRTGENEFLAVAQFKPDVNWIPTSFKWVYSYLCFSVSNLNNLISMTPGFVNYGASSWNMIFSPLVIQENETFNFLVSPNFTVSTFMPSLYLDFGFFGPTIFCAVVGVISVILYKIITEKSNILVPNAFMLLYAIIIYGVVFLYFDNLFFLRQMFLQVVYIVILLLVVYLIKWRKNKR